MYLGMDFVLVIVEDQVFLMYVFDLYMYVFIDVGGGNILVFFELFNLLVMGCDVNMLDWVQYIVFKVDSFVEFEVVKICLQVVGIEVVGLIDYIIFKLIYFFDFNGYCFELVVNIVMFEMMKKFDDVKWDMFNEWDKIKCVFKYVVWMYEKEFMVV